MPELFSPATKPTMYFIGVTTGRSSINAVFPLWADKLGLGDAVLRGWDFPLRDRAEHYRAAVEFIKRDPLSLGALVTSHKIDVFAAAVESFDVIDPLTRTLGEIGSIYKRDGKLYGRAVDPTNVGRALESFLPREHWRDGTEALILGAGGAGTALAWHLNRPEYGEERPARIHVVDPRPERLAELQRLHATWPGARPLVCHAVRSVTESDAVLARLPAGSLVVNATGLGKDGPGSPLGSTARFPERGIVWEFNYRGDLVFLEQARAQQRERELRVEDGWVYFLHGWTSVMADVFAHEIPWRGPVFDELGEIARAVR